MTNFDAALAFALRWEGGYSNHPSDTGGETNKGVTHATYNSYRRSKGLPPRSVRHITQEEVRDIYRTRYWDAAGCNLLPPNLAIAHFDWAVNAGCDRAIKTLQQTIGTVADGIIGPNTKASIRVNLAAHGEVSLVREYCSIREACYRRWGTGSQRVFLAGWLNRLGALRREVA